MHSMSEDFRYQIEKLWNEEGFSSLYHALIVCELVEPSTSRSTQVTRAAAIKNIKEKTAREVMLAI